MRPSLDPFLAMAAFALLGVCAVVAPGPCALVAAAIFAACAVRGARRVAPATIVFALAACGVGGVRCALSLRAHGRSSATAAQAIPHPARCAFEATIVGMPLRRGVMGAEVEARAIDCDGERLERGPPLLVRLYDLPEDVVRGDRFAIVAQLARARRTGSFDLGDDRVSAARRGVVISGTVVVSERTSRGSGVLGWLDRLRVRLRAGIDATIAPAIAPIARALVLGEEDLSDEDGEAFRRSGLTHLLAVSGSHVALAVGTLVALLRAILLRVAWLARRVEVGRVASAIGIPLACAYEQVAGDSGSARRATAMAAVVLAVRALGRRPNVVRTLSLSVLAALALDPFAPFDLSFSLSLAATLGLVALGPPVRSMLESLPAVPRTIRAALGTTLSASVACAPLVAGIAGSVPVLGLAANVIAVPIGELAALPLANLTALLGACKDWSTSLAWLAMGLGKATAGALVALRGVAKIASAPRWATFRVSPPTPMQVGILVAMVCVVHVLAAKGTRLVTVLCLGLSGLLLAEGAHVHAAIPRQRLRITVLDVGQGDATLVDFPDGRAMLVDGGGEVGSPFDPGKAIVAPTLAMRRRRRIDVMVLSHPHPDHLLGLLAVMADHDVGALWDTSQGEVEGAGPSYAALIATAHHRGIPIVRPDALCGSPRPLFGASVEVLHPCPVFDRDRGPNDNSLVIRIGYGVRHALLVGDAEHWAESRLLAEKHDRLEADFLKVGHHGSRTSSTPAFLAVVTPTFATISCGVRNRFGHPHPAALRALEASGARVLRTDRDGAIEWSTDGVSSVLATSRQGW
jgi:competence protein ComEC